MDPQHLKDKEQDISITKNYCITINIKIISSIHIFILKIQVLGSHELKSHCHFWQGTLKNDWINFQPSCICTSMQKIRLFHLFSFEIQSILESHDQTGHTHFWPCPPNNFWSAFNCYKSASTYKKSVIQFVDSSDRVNFRVPSYDWPHPFLTTTTPKIFNILLICMILYQHPKNQLILEIQ